MDTVSLIRGQLKEAHSALEATMADVTSEVADWQPPGQAHSIASRYAHVVVAEDTLMNGVVRGQAPIHATAEADGTGISGDPQAAFGVTLDWSRNVKIDLATLRDHANVWECSVSPVAQLYASPQQARMPRIARTACEC